MDNDHTPTKGEKGMFLRKVLFLAFVFLFAVNGTLYAAGGDSHLRKKNTLSIKIGHHYYRESKFTDYWKIDGQDLGAFAWEFAYEKKMSNRIGIEFSLGHSSSDTTSENVRDSNDFFEVDIQSLYLTPTLKGYVPLNNSFVFYGGIGPDFYYTEIDYKYTTTYDKGDDFFAVGAHGLAGVEYYFLKQPARRKNPSGEPPLFDAPVSFLLEYRYSWVVIQDADGALLLSGLANDFQVGGHRVFVGLRWHY